MPSTKATFHDSQSIRISHSANFARFRASEPPPPAATRSRPVEDDDLYYQQRNERGWLVEIGQPTVPITCFILNGPSGLGQQAREPH